MVSTRLKLFDKLRRKMGIKLISAILISIIALAAALTITSAIIMRSVFQQLYTEKLMIAPYVLLAQYTSEDFLPYVEKLKTTEGFEEAAQMYLADKLYAAEIEAAAGGEYPADYHAAIDRMAEYRKSFSSLKDEDYYSIYRRLLEVRVGSGVKYLYVIADVGFDNAYVYLFDAVFQGDTVNAANDDFGTVDLKTNYHGIEQVFETGEAVLEYGDYGVMRAGALCYSYTPVLDDDGNVIAVIGADINLQSLSSQLNSFLTLSVALVILIACIITVIIIL